MASPPIPPPFDYSGRRPVSFYPAILNVEHNEWLFRKATWSEIVVVNCKTGTEISIPRRFMGEVSRIDDPVLIVGLTRELEYKNGAVWPYQRRVLQMPMAVGEAHTGPSPVARERGTPAPIVGIRLESPAGQGAFRLFGRAMVVAVAAVTATLYVAVIYLSRAGDSRPRGAVWAARDKAFLQLTGADDAAAVRAKLGPPAGDRWRSGPAGAQYRALDYPSRRYTAILMGSRGASARYIGSVDDHWSVIHSVPLAGGGSSESLLRALKRF